MSRGQDTALGRRPTGPANCTHASAILEAAGAKSIIDQVIDLEDQIAEMRKECDRKKEENLEDADELEWKLRDSEAKITEIKTVEVLFAVARAAQGANFDEDEFADLCLQNGIGDHGDLEADINLYTNGDQADESIFIELYGVDIRLAQSLVGQDCCKTIRLLNAVATAKWRRLNLPNLQPALDEFVHYLDAETGMKIDCKDANSPLGRSFENLKAVLEGLIFP